MIRVIAAVTFLALGGPAGLAAETDPLPVPQAGNAGKAVRLYNEGVALLVQRRLAQAQQRFEEALALDDTLAEAHNNLAFSLRMQGAHHFARSLAHYNRAIELKPTLTQAYMYRGALFVQQRDLASARQDLEVLRRLDTSLADQLQRMLEGSGAPDERRGIAGQYE